LKRKITIIKERKKINPKRISMKFEDDKKIDKGIDPKEISRYSMSFPSHYRFMSNVNIKRKTRKK
jgi:hypothetical protein